MEIKQLLTVSDGNAVILIDDDLKILDFSDSLSDIDKKINLYKGKDLFSLLQPSHLFFTSIRNPKHKSLFASFMSKIPTKIGKHLFLWGVHSYKVDSTSENHLLSGIDVSDIASQLNEMTFMRNYIINNIPYYICWKDNSSMFLGCNSNFAKIAGLSKPVEIIGKSDFDLPWSLEQAIKYRRDDQLVMDSGSEKVFYEELQDQSDGKKHVVCVSKIPFHINTRSKGLMCIYRNMN